MTVTISVYMDSGYSVILINRAFLLEQMPNTRIYIMASLILVRGIGSNYYSINKYVLFKIYLPGKRNNKDIRVKITREAYLIDGLKAKILLSIDVIRSEKIDIITLRNKVYINLYDTIVSIDLKSRSRDITIKLVVAEKKTTLLSRN